MFKKEDNYNIKKVSEKPFNQNSSDNFYEYYWKELLKLENRFLPEFEGDCDLSPAFDKEGLYNLDQDPFYKYYSGQFTPRFSTKHIDYNAKASQKKGESFEEYIERRITEPRDEYRELGVFYEKPEGSSELSTKEVAERGVTPEEIDALLVELGYLDQDITPEILYLILYDKEFCEELIDETIRKEFKEKRAFDLEFEEMYDQQVRKLFRFKDMVWFKRLHAYFLWLEGRSMLFAFIKKKVLRVYYKYRKNRPVFLFIFFLYILWVMLMRCI